MSDPIQDQLLRHEHEMHTLTITELQMKFAMLEDDLYQTQDMIEHDNTRWEIKHGTKYEEEIRNVLLQNEPDKTRNLAYVVNDQLLHDIKEDIITTEEDLKIKAIQFVEIPFVQAQSEPIEIPLELTKSAGFKDTVSMESYKMQENLLHFNL
jgi:phospholipid N-methyltransferase